MNELKPVAKINDEFGQVGWLVLPIFKPETLLYIIPDTHRIVSVHFLEELYQEAMLFQTEQKLRAIIDNKEE